MYYNKIKVALVAAGACFHNDKDDLRVVVILGEQYGIADYKLIETSVDIKEIVKQMTVDESKEVKLLKSSYEKQQNRKWYVPKKIGKPQKRKGRF